MRRSIDAGRRAALLLLGVLAASPARADGWSGGVGISSDKVYRGIRQAPGRVALFGDLQYRTDTGWFAALGIAGLDRGSGSTVAETTVGVGRGWQLDPDWTVHLAATDYAYGGRPRPGRYDHAEISAGVNWRGRVGATLAWSPNTRGLTAERVYRTDRAAAVELTWHQPLVGRLALDLGAGYHDLRAVSGAGYAFGSAGLSWGIGPWHLYVARIASRAAARGLAPSSAAGPSWSATALWSF